MPALLVVLSLFGAISQAFGQEAQLRVQTRNDDTGQTVPDVLIQVLWEDSGQLYAEAWTNARGVTTIQVAPLEHYRVRAVTPRHMSQVDLAYPAPGQTLSLTLAIEPMLFHDPDVPFGALSGRVLTPDGEPLPRVNVGISAYSWSALTDNDGFYRFEVPPGTYFVRTSGTSSFHTAPDAPLSDEYGSARRDAVTVTSRTETSGVDLVLSHTRKYRATVTVVDDAGPVSEGHVRFIASDGSAGTHHVNERGVAVIGPLPRGLVKLSAATGTKPSQMAGMTSIEIIDGPRDDVVLTVFPGATLRGRFAGPAGSRLRFPTEVQVRIIPLYPDANDTLVSHDYLVNADGTFLLSGLVGERCLEPNGLWGPGWGVLAITHDGVDITGRAITFDYGQELRDVVVHLGPKEPEPYLGPTPRCTR